LDNQPYFGALAIKEFDTATDKYTFQFSFDGLDLPNTNKKPYIPLISIPDSISWLLWLSRGYVDIFPYVNEFIARMKIYENEGSKNALIINPQFDSKPLYTQILGYLPLAS